MVRETAKCEMRFDGFNVYITRKPKPLSALILWRNEIPLVLIQKPLKSPPGRVQPGSTQVCLALATGAKEREAAVCRFWPHRRQSLNAIRIYPTV